jgi:hypothetical protein
VTSSSIFLVTTAEHPVTTSPINTLKDSNNTIASSTIFKTEQSEDDTKTENSKTEQSEDDTKTENSETEQSEDDTKTENSETEQSEDDTKTENSETEQSEDDTKTENSEIEQSEDDTKTENSETEQSEDDTKTENSETEPSNLGSNFQQYSIENSRELLYDPDKNVLTSAIYRDRQEPEDVIRINEDKTKRLSN